MTSHPLRMLCLVFCTLLTFMGALSAVGCGDDGNNGGGGCAPGLEGCSCDDGQCGVGLDCIAAICQLPNCTAGTLGCSCEREAGCEAGLRCEAGRCAVDDAPVCTPGELGCSCAPGEACDPDPGGSARACINGLCSIPACTAGETGCACALGDRCDDPEATCAAGMCAAAASCTPGELGCGCDAGSCDAGLSCQGGQLCVDAAGHLGGPCLSGGQCHPGNSCQSGLCVPCAPGGLGCVCDGNACGAGLACDGEVCVQRGGPRTPPSTPRCYTPCEESFEDSGVWRTCGANKLMEGCLQGRACVEGHCMLEGEEQSTCLRDTDCPDWQSCIQGGCYATCASDAECGDAQTCQRQVCRDTCSVGGANTCHLGMICEAINGDLGVCKERSNRPAPDAAPPSGILRVGLSEDALDAEISVNFSNLRTRGTFLLVNDSPQPRRVTLRKLRHTTTLESGELQSVDNDADGDNVPDAEDNCRALDNPEQLNADGDLLGDACDSDDDNDALVDLEDNCPLAFNPDQADINRDGLGDACEEDEDGDGVEDAADNCPQTPNPDQTDTNADQQGDACSFTPREIACNPAVDCPLYWLAMGVGDLGNNLTPYRVPSFEVEIPARGQLTLEIADAAAGSGVAWQGVIEARTPGLNPALIRMTYRERPEGAWAGQAFYFANFGTTNLNTWRALPNPTSASLTGTRSDEIQYNRVGNALIRRWSGFRAGRITWESFRAALTSVEAQSWQWPSIRSACGNNQACYPSEMGIETLSADVNTAPIPSGVVELPMAMNLRFAPSGPPQMIGKVNSAEALHYAGEPAVSLEFENDPATPDVAYPTATLAFLKNLRFDVEVGGRYLAADDDSGCAERGATFSHEDFPWLVPGFKEDTSVASDNRRMRYECRDNLLPFSSADPALRDALKPLNASLAAANPIPDGRKRRREVRLVDGALINERFLFVIFEERFSTFFGESSDDEGFSAWGYMFLQRAPDTLSDADSDGDGVADPYDGATFNDQRAEPDDLLQVACTPDLLEQLLGPGQSLGAANAPRALAMLLDGRDPGMPTILIDPAVEAAHVYCEDTGLFDGGPGALRGEPTPCPLGSRVEYFSLDPRLKNAQDLALEPCQTTRGADGRASCQETLTRWRRDRPAFLVQGEARWRCADPDAVLCDQDRLDLRSGKLFYSAQDPGVAFTPLRPQIEDAFRYKTRFQNRQGTSVGFAPQLCIPGSDSTPYCFDAEAIEATRDRVECLLHIWDQHANALDQRDRDRLVATLRETFAETTLFNANNETSRREGFEKLYTELLVMQGDESYTRAFQSRFDLAANRTLAFEGSRFEPDGIDLSGIVGFEMVSLYQAVQYYQLALDRFYSLSPTFWRSLNLGTSPLNFVTADTANTWMERLTRASTQKSRALSEIAQRYQNLNRPDLARRVIERGYTSTYLESIIIARLMQAIVRNADLSRRDQVALTLQDAQRRYRTALLDMRTAYSAINDDINIFGFAPDYIPFPALDSADFRQSNAFEAVLLRAQTKLQIAREREDAAFTSNRTFETDAAQFQSELVRLRNTYENQLADLCGTFQVDGRIYPATEKYAYLHPVARLLGDPCGWVGNGQLHQLYGQIDILRTDLRRHIAAAENVRASAELEQRAVAEQCDLIDARAEYVYQEGQRVASLQEDIRESRFIVDTMEGTLNKLGAALGFASQGANCFAGVPTAPACATMVTGITSTYTVAAAGTQIASSTLNKRILDKEAQIDQINLNTARWETEQECDRVTVLGNAAAQRILLDLRTLDLDMLKVAYQIELNLAEIERLRQQARRLQLQQAESEQLTINVEAARNDPNVRIYRNDAVINAELTFNDALREIYRLTLIFEYYTSQSYAEREQLFLVRLASRGDYNLENYLIDLQNAFFAFEEIYGLPDTRVLQLSLLNDILKIPYLTNSGAALSNSQRVDLMRQELRNPARLDRNGYLTFTFATALSDLSPLTRNHKILYIEAELLGSETGDPVGRIYLRQRGTSTLQTLQDERSFFRFPERTAVINVVFNNVRDLFSPEVYRTVRFRDRPLANSAWDLIINQRDEQVNRDINLQAIDDIKLRVYYTDFTDL